jgi:hypothetical protein
MRRALIEAEAAALAGGLVVKNGSQMRGRTFRRDARPVVDDVDRHGVVAVEAGADRQGADPPIACAALSMRLVHTWFSSAG